MKKLNPENIFEFVELQISLVECFYGKYPSVKDFKWFLDFPKKGSIIFNNEEWEFYKHGVGVRFFRVEVDPKLVVDIHRFFNSPELFDVWRLEIFFKSFNCYINKVDIQLLLEEMCRNKYLLKRDNGFFERFKK